MAGKTEAEILGADARLDHEEAARLHDELARKVAEANRAYFQDDAPVLSDADYDAAKRRLAALETHFPDLGTAESPTARIGAAPSETFAKVRHRVRMLSLENAFEDAEITDFDDRIRNFPPIKTIRSLF